MVRDVWVCAMLTFALLRVRRTGPHGHVYRRVRDEALQVHVEGGHCMVPHLPPGLHHWAPAALSGCTLLWPGLPYAAADLRAMWPAPGHPSSDLEGRTSGAARTGDAPGTPSAGCCDEATHCPSQPVEAFAPSPSCGRHLVPEGGRGRVADGRLPARIGHWRG